MGEIVLDASVLIDVLRGDVPSQDRLGSAFTAGDSFHLPASAYSELLVHPYRQAQAHEAVDRVDHFLDSLRIRVQPITAEIAHEAARLRAHDTVKMPDALIIATALVLEAGLLTSDRRMTRVHDSARAGQAALD